MHPGRHADATPQRYHSMLRYVQFTTVLQSEPRGRRKSNQRSDAVSRSAWRHLIAIDLEQYRGVFVRGRRNLSVLGYFAGDCRGEFVAVQNSLPQQFGHQNLGERERGEAYSVFVDVHLMVLTPFLAISAAAVSLSSSAKADDPVITGISAESQSRGVLDAPLSQGHDVQEPRFHTPTRSSRPWSAWSCSA